MRTPEFEPQGSARTPHPTASTSSDSSAPKKMKPLTSSFVNPIDATPVSSMPSKDLVPFDEEYVIPSESYEENPSAASLE